MKKIPSFTIMELVITLLISSVVISTGYYAYFVVRHRFDIYRTRGATMDRYYLLSGALQNDFDRAESVRFGEDSQLVCRWTDTAVLYRFLPETIVRTLPGGIVDSFSLKTTIKDIRYLDDSLPLVNGIRMQVEVDRERVSLLVRKIYSSQEILQGQTLRDENTTP